MSSEKEKLKETLQVINNYMNKKNINMSLQQQIREYLEYYLKESIMNDNETEDKIIDMLSEPLKRSLMIEANKIALKDSPIFRNNFSESTISKTVSLIQELRCTPEEVLFYEGDIDNSAIFFVQQGKVELFIDSYKSTGETVVTSLKVFSKGSSFGETSFFTGSARGISIRSIDFTTLLMIKRQDFLNVVKENSEDYENYCKIRDKITFYKNFDDLGIKCISCNNRNHFLNDCPFIHFVPDKEKIIKIHQLPSPQERSKGVPDREEIQLHQTNKYHALNNQDEILNCMGEFLDQIDSYLEKQDWYDGNAEDEEEYEIYNQYDDEDEDEEDIKNLEGGVQDNNLKYYYQQQQQQQQQQQFESNRHDQYLHQTSLTHPSPFKEDSYVPQQTLERLSYRKDEAQQYLQNPQQIGAGETHSHKGQLNNLGVDEKRERSASNLGLNELTLTPSGLVLNLINPNPGNVRESSQKAQPNKKRSSSNSNLNNNIPNPQILYNKSNTLNDEQGILAVQSSNYNISNSNILPTPLLNAIQNQNSINANTNISNPNSNNPFKDPTNNFSIKQSSVARANSLVRRGTKRKNTEKTARSTHKRKSTKRTIDSKMNVQVSTNSYQNERKPMKKLTVMRRGFQENQIQNTLLALQGMENILLQNKSNSNSNEFDVMKNFEIYFPHNNIDVVIFQLRKKNPHLYAKSKSFVKSQTKKLYGAMTMNSQHNRMSKMDIVLQKFLMSEMDDDKDKDSLVSATRQKSQTYNTHKTDHYKTPKHYANNDWQSRNSRMNEKKRSYNNSHNDIIDLQGSPLQTKSRCKSMKTISQHFNTNQDANSRFQHNMQEDESSIQQSIQHDEIYLEGFEKQQQNNPQQQIRPQSSLISSKANSHNRIIAEEVSPKKNVSFQDNFQDSNLHI